MCKLIFLPGIPTASNGILAREVCEEAVTVKKKGSLRYNWHTRTKCNTESKLGTAASQTIHKVLYS
jgi:hypothetical protein